MAVYSKTEMIFKKVFELNPDSPNYWSNLFNFADILFNPENIEDKEQKELCKVNQERLHADIQRIMHLFRQGTFTPSFFLIQRTMAQMMPDDFIKVKTDSSVTRIYKIQLENELESMKSWIMHEIGRMPIRISSPNLNVMSM